MQCFINKKRIKVEVKHIFELVQKYIFYPLKTCKWNDAGNINANSIQHVEPMSAINVEKLGIHMTIANVISTKLLRIIIYIKKWKI